MGRNYWMVVESPEDFEITRGREFTVFGVKSRHRRRAQRMQPDDRILFYITGIRKWTATAIIKSDFFEDRTPIWTPGSRGEVYPFRVKTEPEIVLDEEDYIDALLLAPRMDYVKRWAPEDWPLAFFDSLHLIPQKDYRLIEGEMKRIIYRLSKYRGRHKVRPGEDEPQEFSFETETEDGLMLEAERNGYQSAAGEFSDDDSDSI